MTVTSQTTKVTATGNGSATTFSFSPLVIFASTDLVVVTTVTATGVETVRTEGTGATNWSTSLTSFPATGSIVYPADTVTPLPSTETITIKRVLTLEQQTDLENQGTYFADTQETQFDKLLMIDLQQQEIIDRSFSFPLSYTGSASAEIPAPVANAYLLWNAAGTSLTTSSTSAAQFLGGNGTVSLPFYSYSDDPDSGHYRIGANNLGLTVGGTKLLDYGAATLGLTGALTTSGIISVDDTTESTSGTTGSIHTDGGLGVAKKLHVMGTTTHGGDVLSDTDSTDSLGSTGVRWLKLWVDSIQTTANTDIAGDLTVTGNLTVNGTTVTNDATNTEIKDPLIELNSGAGSNANDLGILMERGSTGDNVFMGWDESGDYFGFGTTTATADSTGNITYSLAQARFAGLNLSGTSADLGAVTTIDINGGTVDGAVIGGASAAAITGTTLTANTSITLATGGAMTGVLDSDTMSGASTALLSTSESIKAYVDNNAPENGVKFAFESTTTDTDQGAGKVWLNHGTPSSASVLYVDDVEAGGVSVNSWVDTWDDVSNAVARGYVYIASYGTTNAILVYKVTGSVSSASTYSKVAVTHVLTVGTISDGDSIGLTFVPSGVDGAGSGDMEASNNLSDVASAATSFGNIKQAASASATGVVEIATAAEVNTGTDTARVVTPDTLEQFVTGATTATITASDEIVFADVGSSNAKKKDTVQGILDLVSGGKVLQVVQTTDSAVATGSTVFPVDDTVPQNDEGNEWMTLAVTPASASNLLRIDVCVNQATTSDDSMACAIFQDTTANALAATAYRQSAANKINSIYMTHWMTAGTTSATTFKVRGGGMNSGTITFNGVSSGRLFGGVMSSFIIITEVEA